MSRIVFISPYRDLSELGRQEAAKLGIQVEFYEASMDEAGRVIDTLGEPAVDIFVSRGGTADWIAQHYPAPVVRVNTGPFDLLECLYEARQASRHVALTSFAQPYVGTEMIARILDLTITNVVFRDLAELERKISLLAETEHCCVVGGGPSVRFAARAALPSVFLRTSPATICEALQRAQELAELSREEKRKASRLNAILASVFDGIIAVDAKGKVELVNEAAARMLDLQGPRLIGRDVAEVVPNSRLRDVLDSGESQIGELQDAGSVRIITNRVPIKSGDEVVGAVATFQEVSRIVQAERRMRRELADNRFSPRFRFADIVGDSAVMVSKKRLAADFAKSDLTVLIYGESGTGKELFAQSIHSASKRRFQPFVAVNLGALPNNLLESELFGYEEGAFTGARRKGKMGFFEMAHGGTLFLDEIDALPIELQGRLLRVLQEKEVLRVGGEALIPVDIRIIAATNRLPRQLLASKLIREDLFYRLDVLYLELPPLRERKEDIALLLQRFLPPSVSAEAAAVLSGMIPLLQQYSWPGNVRELFNFSQRLQFYHHDYAAHGNAKQFLAEILPNAAQEWDIATRQSAGWLDQMAQIEKQTIEEVLRQSANSAEAATKLGMSRATLWRKIRRLKLDDQPRS